MSAFMCAPEHFGLLAAFACRDPDPHRMIPEPWRRPARQAAAVHVAEELARENARSLTARYGDAPEEHAGTIAEAGTWAARYLTRFPDLSPAHVIGHATCYAYQACESRDWDQTPAHELIERIKDAAGAVPRAPGCWEWTDPSRQH